MQILFTKMSLIKLIKLDQTCFQHDMAYGNSKYIAKRTQSDKALRDKASKIVSDPEYDGYQRGLASMVYNFFLSFSLVNKSAAEPNDQLANEHHKNIKKFKRRNVYSSYRDYIWSVDLADMQSLSKYNKGIKYLLCEIDLFSKYVWFVPLKNERRISIVNVF